MNKIWFKRKLYGFGWTPSSWEGWLVMGIYILLSALLFIKIDVSASENDTLRGFAAPFVIITLILLLVTYTKGESPRWQWGEDKGDVD